MKKILSTLLLSCSILLCFAQEPVIQWAKCYGGSNEDILGSVAPTRDGGYILAGYTTSNDGDVSGNHGGSDSWIVKIDSVGGLQWQKCLGGSANDGANWIEQAKDGGYIVAGLSDSNDGNVSGNHEGGGDGDDWIVKTDSNGNIQWQKCFGGTKYEEATFIQQTDDKGYIVAGYTDSDDGDVTGFHGTAGYGLNDYWVLKLDSTGGLQWEKCLGGIQDDDAYAVMQTRDGGYIVSGSAASTDGDVKGSHGAADFWLVKLDNNGNLQWQKCLGGSNGELAFSMQIAKDGGFIMTGPTESDDGNVSGYHGDNDYWVVKTDSLGNLQYQNCFGGSSLEEAYAVVQTNDGGYIVCGESNSTDDEVSGNHGGNDYWIVKLDTALNIEWQKCLGGSNEEEQPVIRQTSDEGYIVAGTSYSNDGQVSGQHGNGDFWVVKLSPTPLGISENNLFLKGQYTVYPNPAESMLYINGHSLLGKIDLTITDVFGRNVYSSIEETTGTLNKIIDVGRFSAGVYFIQVANENQRTVLKFVKEW